MRMLDAEQTHRLLDFPYLVEALQRAHLSPMPGVDEIVMTEPRGDRARSFIALPAWSAGQKIGIKLVTVFPDNPNASPPRPSNQGIYALFDGTDGTPSLLIDGTALTLRKTAADSALGVQLLAREDAKSLLLVGAGGLAPYVARAIYSVRPSLDRIMIWNRTHQKATELATQLNQSSDFDAPRSSLEIQAIANLDEAVATADIISCATMANQPLIKGRLLKPGTHVDLIGGWRPDMRECDDDTIKAATLFTDSREFSRECGDFTQAIESGAMEWSDLQGDLFELCSGSISGRTSIEQITLFKNAGGGHIDLFTAQAVLERLAQQ